MNKVKVLSIISIGLVITNLILIWFFTFNRHHPHGKDRPSKIIIEKLGFDAKQITEYEKLIDWHKTEIRKAEANLFDLKHELYATLINDSANRKDSLFIEISQAQNAIEQIHYKHFNDIKQLCHPDQLSAFEELSEEVANLFQRTRPR